jgi:hypothetical protein
MSAPVIDGEIAAPVVRATPATPAAAERSSGSTTAIVYDWRVGTSICEMLKRSNKTSTANGKVGIKGTRISRMFEGMCVNVLVLHHTDLDRPFISYNADLLWILKRLLQVAH